jgi:tetratricopeptide (TPR) repeat protein
LKGGRDADPRQRTLRATIEWSHDLLSGEERALFARLSVFAGGCTLEAGEQVADADLDTLQSLVDKSLLRHTDERFWMLETIREFAVERLDDLGEAEEVRRRHAERFLALAEEAWPNLRGDPGEWLDRLEREHDNLRAALDRLERSGETQHALQLAGALSRFWYMRGYQVEGQRRLESALRADERPTAVRARALNGAAMLAGEIGDHATLRLRAEEALVVHRELGDAWGTAYSVYLLGYAALEERDYARAQQLFDDSLRAFRELGDEHYILSSSFNLAWMCGELGDLDRERALHEDNLDRARATSNRRIEALSLSNLALFARSDGRIQDALSMLHEAYRIHRDLGEPVEVADMLSRFASTLAFAGSAEAAARLLSCSEALREESGVRRSWVAQRNEETLTTLRGQLDEAGMAEAWEQGRKLTADEAVALALASQ